MPSMQIAERVRRIKPSASTSAADRANQLRRDGRSIVNLAVGEPDFDTPLHIRLAAGRAMEAGETRYGSMTGSPVLREAISNKLHRDNGLAYGPDEIIVTAGAKSAIYGLLATTLGAGDEVIIPAPYWVSYPDMVLACDGVPVTVACPEAQGFQAHAGRSRGSHHAADALADPQLAGEPDRCHLLGGGVSGVGGGARRAIPTSW